MWYEAHGIPRENWDTGEGWTLPIRQDDEAETPSTPLPISLQELPLLTTPLTIRSKVSIGEASLQRSPETEKEIEVVVKRPLTRSRALSQRQDEGS